MRHLLHIDSSLRTEGFRSRQLSAHFADRWRTANPTASSPTAISPPTRSRTSTTWPFFAQFVPEPDRTPEQAAAVALGAQLVDEVLAADTILIGLPLYNFGPPSTFKAWFDRIVSERTMGKLGDKEFVVVSARGGGYGPGTPREGWDHREPWLRHALTSLGVENATFINTELTLARESPKMIPLDLGAAEDQSLSEAFAAIDSLFVAEPLSVK